jgi:hypothetical protein
MIGPSSGGGRPQQRRRRAATAVPRAACRRLCGRWAVWGGGWVAVWRCAVCVVCRSHRLLMAPWRHAVHACACRDAVPCIGGATTRIIGLIKHITPNTQSSQRTPAAPPHHLAARLAHAAPLPGRPGGARRKNNKREREKDIFINISAICVRAHSDTMPGPWHIGQTPHCRETAGLPRPRANWLRRATRPRSRWRQEAGPRAGEPAEMEICARMPRAPPALPRCQPARAVNQWSGNRKSNARGSRQRRSGISDDRVFTHRHRRSNTPCYTLHHTHITTHTCCAKH